MGFEKKFAPGARRSFYKVMRTTASTYRLLLLISLLHWMANDVMTYYNDRSEVIRARLLSDRAYNKPRVTKL